jgi:hypothetical protein
MITVPDNRATFEFMAGRLGLKNSEDFRGVMFVPEEYRNARADMAHVGVAYGWHGFIGRTCVINIVVQKPECLTRAVIREAFRYPFQVAGCKSVLAMVDSVNTASMLMCRRTGFKHLKTIPDGGLEGDLVIWEMRPEFCRWLRQEH